MLWRIFLCYPILNQYLLSIVFFFLPFTFNWFQVFIRLFLFLFYFFEFVYFDGIQSYQHRTTYSMFNLMDHFVWDPWNLKRTGEYGKSYMYFPCSQIICIQESWKIIWSTKSRLTFVLLFLLSPVGAFAV